MIKTRKKRSRSFAAVTIKMRTHNRRVKHFEHQHEPLGFKVIYNSVGVVLRNTKLKWKSAFMQRTKKTILAASRKISRNINQRATQRRDFGKILMRQLKRG